MSKYRGRPCDVDTCEYVAPDGNHPSGLARVANRVVCRECRAFYRDSGSWPDEQTTLTDGGRLADFEAAGWAE